MSTVHDHPSRDHQAAIGELIIAWARICRDCPLVEGLLLELLSTDPPPARWPDFFYRWRNFESRIYELPLERDEADTVRELMLSVYKTLAQHTLGETCS